MSGEFEGRTAEEALDRARRSLGPTAELRCWKTRRGGIGGFFATEVFIASVEPPAGALATPSKGMFRRRSATKDAAGRGLAHGGADTVAGGPVGGDVPGSSTMPAAATAPSGAAVPGRSGDAPPTVPPVEDPPGDAVPPVVTYERPSHAAGDDMADSLAALADGTTDQLSLNFDSIPSQSFDEVLAEAEAAVAGVTAWSDRPGPSVQMVVAPPDEPAGAGDGAAVRTPPGDGSGRDALPEDREGTAEAAVAPPEGTAEGGEPGGPVAGQNGTTAPGERRRRTRPKPSTSRPPRRPVPAVEAAAAVVPAPRPIPDLFERLRALGVPADHLPGPGQPTLDDVARSMDGLPEVPPLPTAPGSVVAVVGTAAAVARTARLLTGVAPYRHGPRPDPARSVWAPETSDSDGTLDDVLQEGEPLEVAGQVARRRLDGRPSLVTVEVVPGHPVRSHDRLVISSVQPDYVLGAIEASVKRADVERWRDDLEHVDAMALWDLDGTVSPAELLGVLPIAFVDGVPGTPVAWTLQLLHRAAEGDG